MKRLNWFGVVLCILGGLLLVFTGNSHAALIGYYNFDGNANEVTGNNIDLNAVGDAGYAPGMNTGLGQAGTFDGDGDGFIGQNFVKSTTNNLTVVAWVYANSRPQWATIVKNWGWNFGQFHLGLLQFFQSGGNTCDPTGALSNFSDGTNCPDSFTGDSSLFPLNAWHHVAVVLDAASGTHTLYLDGAVVDVNVYDGVLDPGIATGLGIGIKPNDDGSGIGSATGSWDGFIDEVGIYDHALSQADIQAIITAAQHGVPLFRQGEDLAALGFGGGFGGAPPGLDVKFSLFYSIDQAGTELFEDIILTEAEVGSTFTATSTDDPQFDTFVSFLTNGTDEFICRGHFGGSGCNPESIALIGPDNPDLQGAVIDSVSMTVNALQITSMETSDQSFVPTTGSGALEVSANQLVTQTFTIGVSGKLIRTNLVGIRQHRCPASDDLMIDIVTTDASGAPSTTVLASATLAPAAFPSPSSPFGTVSVDISSFAISVVAGDVLGVALRTSAPAGGCDYVWNGDFGGYSDGAAFLSGITNSRDMGFETIVATGTNVSSNLTFTISGTFDTDGDGILNAVDGEFISGAFVDQRTVFSNNFTDEHVGGTSFGFIQNRADLTVTVEDAIANNKMYWTELNSGKIRRANLDGTNVEDLITGLDTPVGIALDQVSGKMYWTSSPSPGNSKIQRANLDGTGVEDLITGLAVPEIIALDKAGGKMYWTDDSAKKIQRANLDGTNVEDLVTTGLSFPFGIVLDVADGKMYWADCGTNKIQRANLDGTNVEDVITGLGCLFGFTIDLISGKMYWTGSGGKIRRANIDGTDVEDVITGIAPTEVELDLAGGRVYWTDAGGKIRRANLDGTHVEDLVITGMNPQDIALQFDNEGLRIEAAGGGLGEAQISGCSDPQTEVHLTDGDSAIITCGSATIRGLTGEVAILPGDDVDIVVVAPSGAAVTFEQSNEGQIDIENKGTDIEASLGDEILVTVPSGTEVTVSESKTTEGQFEIVNTSGEEAEPISVTFQDVALIITLSSDAGVALVESETIEDQFEIANISDDGAAPISLEADGQTLELEPDQMVELASEMSPIPPTVGEIDAPVEPVPVGVEIVVKASFHDPNIGDIHTAEWNWGDGGASVGTLNEGLGDGEVTGSHIYTVPGVYVVTSAVSDGASSNEAVFQFVVAYDPDGGFVTGGGWIDSLSGACQLDTCSDDPMGKATFGFVSKYKKGASVPIGETEFQFKAGDLNFHSDTYDWLVVAGHKAMFKGTGTINGTGNYGFLLSAIDEKLTASTDVDLFRIKIWDQNAGDRVVYDNQMGDGDDADPDTAIGGGNIVVHKGK